MEPGSCPSSCSRNLLRSVRLKSCKFLILLRRAAVGVGAEDRGKERRGRGRRDRCNKAPLKALKHFQMIDDLEGPYFSTRCAR